MKIKIILLLLSFISFIYPQQDTIKKIFNLQGDIRNPTFFFSYYYPYQYPQGNDLLFELHSDSSSNIYISHYDSESDSFFIETALTDNNAKNINPSGRYFYGNKIVIFQTNLKGNWDIAFREFKKGLWDSVKVLYDMTGDETNPVFIDPLPPWFDVDTTLRILFEKNNSIYLYERTDNADNYEIIFKGSDSVIYSLPTATLTYKERNNQDVKVLKIAAKLDSAGKEKIVSVFKHLNEKVDSNYIIVDTGKVNNPKFQMVYAYDPSFYLTYEKGNNIFLEDYFCSSCLNNTIPFKNSVIGKIYNLNIFPIIRPVTKSFPGKYYEAFIGNPNSYVNLRNDSAFIFLFGDYYVSDYYVYSKVKDNHPTAGIAGEYEYKEANYIIWEDSVDQHIQLFGKRILISFSDIDGEPAKPNNFYLFQNYPNPFNPSTKIDFIIPKTSFVTLKIFDVLGRMVKTLINESKPIGKYQVEFNGTNLSSGVYFYFLKAGDFIQTRKMILLK